MKCDPYGVLLTRAQPFHKGHMDVVKQILNDNCNVLILIGSANKTGTERNPLDIQDRIRLVQSAVWDEFGNTDTASKIKIASISDWSMENAYEFVHEWGDFLYYNIVNIIQEKKFSLYYNDNIETAQNWFTGELQHRVSIVHAERLRDVSGTKIRKAILLGNTTYLKDALYPSAFNMCSYIKNVIEQSVNKDFIMN